MDKPTHLPYIACVRFSLRALVLALAGMFAAMPALAEPMTYNTVMVDGVKIFYREAGPKDAPVILLLHGFPTSSRMYQGLMPLLADRYHLIAPDYPGFGNSDAPPPAAIEPQDGEAGTRQRAESEIDSNALHCQGSCSACDRRADLRLGRE